MSKVSAAVASAQVTQDQAEWHPYNVWAAQVRRTDAVQAATTAAKGERDSWDPFSVWQRQVKR